MISVLIVIGNRVFLASEKDLKAMRGNIFKIQNYIILIYWHVYEFDGTLFGMHILGW